MCRVTYVGHATVRVDIDGTSLVTDPLFRRRLLHLRRHGGSPDPAHRRGADAILVSHLHLDHADLRSLRELGETTPILAPPGAAKFLAGKGFRDVTELAPGESTRVGSLDVTATDAVHCGTRWPKFGHEGPAVGYLIDGTRHVYFAGDTDLFDGMGEISDRLDLALLPVWGWGTSVGEGHLDPERAARAAALLRPRVAVPIHWGTFFPYGMARRHGHLLRDPPHEFARETATAAPGVEVRVLAPGDELDLAAPEAGSAHPASA